MFCTYLLLVDEDGDDDERDDDDINKDNILCTVPSCFMTVTYGIFKALDTVINGRCISGSVCEYLTSRGYNVDIMVIHCAWYTLQIL